MAIIQKTFFLLLVISSLFGEEVDHRYHFDVNAIEFPYLPDVKAESIAFNNQIPGPTIRVKEGDWVEVTVKNNTPLPHTIHWHGLYVNNDMDGVPYVTQDPIEEGQTFTYRWKAEPPGTHFYHCHWSALLHIAGGMYGPLVIEPKDKKKDINEIYDVKNEYFLMLDDINPQWQDKMLNMMLKMQELVAEGKKEANPTFASVKEYEKAIKEGYKPPYLTPRPIATPTMHLINGHPYPLTPPLKGKVGEATRFRFASVGSRAHYMHVHGMDGLVVAIDGNNLEIPQRLNTFPIRPGQTMDVILKPIKPGYWIWHDHEESGSTNAGYYPGGMLMIFAVEDENGFISDYKPRISLNE